AGAHIELALARVRAGDVDGAREALPPSWTCPPTGVSVASSTASGTSTPPSAPRATRALQSPAWCARRSRHTAGFRSGYRRLRIPGPGSPGALDGPRVILRAFHPDDLDATMGVVGAPDVTASLSFDTRSRGEQAARLAADVARAQADPRPDYYLAVVAKDTSM